MADYNAKILRAKLSESQEALLEEMGTALATTEGFDLGAFNPEELRRKGEMWVELHKANLIKKICVDWNLPEKMKDPLYQDDVILACAIADLIAGLVTKVAPVTVAALLVKRGIVKLCVSSPLTSAVT